MITRQIFSFAVALGLAAAQNDQSLTFSNSFSTITGSIPTSLFSGTAVTYVMPTGQSVVSSNLFTTGYNGSTIVVANATLNATSASTSVNSQITVSTTSHSLTQIGGLTPTTSSNGTASSTSSSAQPTNTVPCNGFPEFCNRKFSNISNVCSHNSAFAVKNNAASNQEYPIEDQLNDGVRMLQGEVHWVNNTLFNCHTSCDLLNAGTFQSELEVVRQWLRDNPYDVLSILISNSDQTAVENFVPAITNAGVLDYVYEPAYIPQYREQWPTLGEMILHNKRLVFFMDFKADQSKVPYILDQYSHIWQTPFSPVDRAFPCTIASPTGLNETIAKENYMYLANHNLNTAVNVSAILGTDTGTILIPNTAELNVTNGAGLEYGSLGTTLVNCTDMWGLPPNFLVVDYYNIGSPEAGSVFHVAAKANNVTYTKACCGQTSAASSGSRPVHFGVIVVLAAFVVIFA